MRIVAAAWLVFTVGGGGVPSMLDSSSEAARLLALLPRESLGWTSGGEDRIFDRETIFEYIDGSGEVYRAFNMRLLASRRFHKAGQADVIIDLFDMGSPVDAFGVFTHDLEGEDWGLGQGSLYKGGLLQFWRGRYFVSIFAESENSSTTAVLAELGKKTAAALGPDGPKPDLVGLVPEEFADGPIRYLHDPQILNYHFYIGPENPLGLGPGVDAVLASIGDRAEKRTFLLVRGRDEAAAESARRGLLRAFVSAGRQEAEAAAGEEGDIFPMKDGRFGAAARRGRFTAAVFGGKAPEDARAALARAVRPLPR